MTHGLVGMLFTRKALLRSGFFLFLLPVLCVFLSVKASAQPAPIRKADAFYAAGGFYEALNLYKENLVLLSKEELPAYLFRVGECYRRTGKPRQAELWYQKAIYRERAEPKAILYNANSLLS